MRRVVVVSVALVLVLFFGGADASYAATSWRITGLYVPGSASGAPYFPYNLPNTAWGLTTSGHVGGYASLMYLHNYKVGGVPITMGNNPVTKDSEFYCDDFYDGCIGNLNVPSYPSADGIFEAGGTYLAWVQTGSKQREVASAHIDVIPSNMGYSVSFVVPSKVESGSNFTVSWSFIENVPHNWARVDAVYYAWYGQTGWRSKSFSGESFVFGGDDYKIDDNSYVDSGHLFLMFKVARYVCIWNPWPLNVCSPSYWYYGYFVRDVWVGDYDVAGYLTGGVVEMPETGYVDVLYSGGWYPVAVPVDLGYTCNWLEKPSFLSAKGKGNCQVEGIAGNEGFYGWKLQVTASNGESMFYDGKINIRKFEDVVGVPGGTGLTSWVIGLTNTASTGIGEIVTTLDHTRVVFTNAVKSLNVTVDDSLTNFDTSKITQFVAFSKSMLPPGAGLPIAAWIAVTGIDVVVGFVGLIKGLIKWW